MEDKDSRLLQLLEKADPARAVLTAPFADRGAFQFWPWSAKLK
jgi:hypothetical protein